MCPSSCGLPDIWLRDCRTMAIHELSGVWAKLYLPRSDDKIALNLRKPVRGGGGQQKRRMTGESESERGWLYRERIMLQSLEFSRVRRICCSRLKQHACDFTHLYPRTTGETAKYYGKVSVL